MIAADIMTSDVVSLSIDTTIADAARTMLRFKVRGIPITDRSNNVVGILTERDLLRRIELGTEKVRSPLFNFFADTRATALSYVLSHSRKVEDVMTRNVITITEETSLEEVAEILESKRIRQLPVLRDGRLVGIVTMIDLVRALLPKFPLSVDESHDEAIRNRLNKELGCQPWSPQQCRVVVRSGVVDLWGVIYNENQREAMRVAVENVSGVKEFRDHLTYAAPLGNYSPPPIEQ